MFNKGSLFYSHCATYIPLVGNNNIPLFGSMVSGPKKKLFGTYMTSSGRTIDCPGQGNLESSQRIESPRDVLWVHTYKINQ
jgi:hypothetical protein